MGRGAGALTHAPALPSYDPDDLDEATGEENEAAEEAIGDAATPAAQIRFRARMVRSPSGSLSVIDSWSMATASALV